jgi:hypothetical protein
VAVFDGITQAIVTQQVQAKLGALRDALAGVQDMHNWTAGVAGSDLVALGFSSGGASDILSAVADANALAQIYQTGLPPGTYPQPAAAYVYEASQAAVLGP